VLDVQDIVAGRAATFRWTATGRAVRVKFRCRADAGEPTLKFQLTMNGHAVGEDGSCYLSQHESLDVYYTAEQQAAAGVQAGQPAELSVSFSDTALEPYSPVDPVGRRVPIPPGAQAVVAFGTEMDWADYPFPSAPSAEPSLPPRKALEVGPPAIVSGADPTQPRSITIVWGENYSVRVWPDAPAQLHVVVAGVPLEVCSVWDYGGRHGCTYRDHMPAVGATVTVTVEPEHASGPWSVWIDGNAHVPLGAQASQNATR
jgi:hypothetical protein